MTTNSFIKWAQCSKIWILFTASFSCRSHYQTLGFPVKKKRNNNSIFSTKQSLWIIWFFFRHKVTEMQKINSSYCCCVIDCVFHIVCYRVSLPFHSSFCSGIQNALERFLFASMNRIVWSRVEQKKKEKKTLYKRIPFMRRQKSTTKVPYGIIKVIADYHVVCLLMHAPM